MFQPEIQEIFYRVYGPNLESMLQYMDYKMEDILLALHELGNPRKQKVILLGLGIVTDTPMSCEEVANELGIASASVSRIMRRFFQPCRGESRAKKLREFLE